MNVTINGSVEVDDEEIARSFGHMPSDQQAEFFRKLIEGLERACVNGGMAMQCAFIGKDLDDATRARLSEIVYEATR